MQGAFLKMSISSPTNMCQIFLRIAASGPAYCRGFERSGTKTSTFLRCSAGGGNHGSTDKEMLSFWPSDSLIAAVRMCFTATIRQLRAVTCPPTVAAASRVSNFPTC